MPFSVICCSFNFPTSSTRNLERYGSTNTTEDYYYTSSSTTSSNTASSEDDITSSHYYSRTTRYYTTSKQRSVKLPRMSKYLSRNFGGRGGQSIVRNHNRRHDDNYFRIKIFEITNIDVRIEHLRAGRLPTGEHIPQSICRELLNSNTTEAMGGREHQRDRGWDEPIQTPLGRFEKLRSRRREEQLQRQIQNVMQGDRQTSRSNNTVEDDDAHLPEYTDTSSTLPPPPYESLHQSNRVFPGNFHPVRAGVGRDYYLDPRGLQDPPSEHLPNRTHSSIPRSENLSQRQLEESIMLKISAEREEGERRQRRRSRFRFWEWGRGLPETWEGI